MEDIVDMDDGYDEERNGIGNLTELDFRVMYDVDGRYSAAASNFLPRWNARPLTFP